MSEIILLKESNCKDCYKCIRHCPVKAISFAENRAEIIPDECILCGQCYVVCPQNAKQIRSDVDKVKAAIRAGKRVVASVAPSFIADFQMGGIEDMEETLKRLGFAAAEETALGAELVSREYERMVREGKQSVIISSCCPSVNSLIQKYYPEMLRYLAHVLSPMQAHCKRIREKDPGAYTVFIGPCIAKKGEADESKYTDVALTFNELQQWMTDEGIEPVRKEREAKEGVRARFYPTTGGILKSMQEETGYRYMAVDGTENCMAMLEELQTGEFGKVFIEMSACEGSCINGPSIREHRQSRLKGNLRVDNYAGGADFGVEPLKDISQQFAFRSTHSVQPGREAIQAVLNQMGKTTPDKELNCGCCGYPTCRDKAIAVCQGKAVVEMCLPFLKEKAESFSDKIIGNTPNAIMVLNEDLIVEQINKAALDMFKLRSADDILHGPVVRMLDPTDYLNVVTTGRNIYNKCHYVAEYKIFVEETILYDKQYRILISIMRDVTDREEMRKSDLELRRQTAEITDKVIDKQMRVVQEIASLLGETTAETKIALTKLKDAIQHE